MRKSKLIPTLEDAFSYGKIEGQKEILEEMLTMAQGFESFHLKNYLRARLKTLQSLTSKNPFKGEK